MSLRTINILAVYVLCIVAFTTCKKYPEDGKLSDETARKRLVHKWQLKECLVEGFDVIYKENSFSLRDNNEMLIDSVVFQLKDFTIEFRYYKNSIDGHTEKVYDVIWEITNYNFRLYENIFLHGGNEWELKNKKKNIKFKNPFRNTYYFPNKQIVINLLYNESNEGWNIRKLTDKELILEVINSENKQVRLKFNRL